LAAFDLASISVRVRTHLRGWRLMASAAQIESREADHETRRVRDARPFFSIADLAERWRCSRGTVYNVIRGEKVLDFAAPGHKGKKLVPAEVVRAIEQSKMKVWR
jgi:hypothetical protein